MAARIAEAGGALDILVHVVGGASTPSGGFAVITDEQWIIELNLNFLGSGAAGSSSSPGDDRVRVGRGAALHLDPA